MSTQRPDDAPLCRGTTKTGDPCKRLPKAGAAFCPAHGEEPALGGRKTKLDAALIAQIEKGIEAGLTYEVVARTLNIGNSTLAAWKAKGRDHLELGTVSVYRELVEALTRAEAVGEETLVKTIAMHSMGDWRAGAWLLERRYAARWSKTEKLDVMTNERSEPKVVGASEPDRAAEITAILAAATAPPPGA